MKYQFFVLKFMNTKIKEFMRYKFMDKFLIMS